MRGAELGDPGGMTCLFFILLKAWKVVEYPDDYWRALVLLGFDHLALIGWLRYHELRRR